jgi:hypothetical protein
MSCAYGTTMTGVAAVAGEHHFSGSWLGLDGSKSLSLRKEVGHRVLESLLTSHLLVLLSAVRMFMDAAVKAGVQRASA